MKTIYLLFLCILFPCLAVAANPQVEIRVMSFNIWHGGGSSVEATVNVLLESKADIIGIQESFKGETNTAVRLADSLGWYSYHKKGSPSIISKFAIVDTSANGYGVKIQLDPTHFAWMFNVHLMYCPYEPYQLNGIEYCGSPLLSTAGEAIASAWKTRREEVQTVIKDIKAVQKEGFPIFLTGDFNEPSCLDWTNKAAKAGLCKIPVDWPATKAFMKQAKMKDSYRTFYPDEVENPGHTWTTLPEKIQYKEILDRIDFVLYWGKQAKLTNSSIIGEKSEWSDFGFADYPSDHRAVISTFSLSSSY